MNLLFFLLSVSFTNLSLASNARESELSNQDSLPIIQVELEPPRVPYPEVQASISVMKRKHEEKQRVMFRSLEQAFDNSLKSALSSIDSLIAQLTARLGLHSKTGPSFLTKGVSQLKISMLPSAAPDASLERSMKSLERKRDNEEENLFSRATREFQALTHIVLERLKVLFEEELKLRNPTHRNTGLSFLALGQHTIDTAVFDKVNVRVLPSEKGYPRVADYFQEMEEERTHDEQNVRGRILELQVTLLDAEHRAIQQKLQAILHQFSNL